MTIETKELVISEELKRKVEMICRFAYVDYEFINGNIKSIKNTNIAYVKPHILKVKNNDYLIFDNSSQLKEIVLDKHKFYITHGHLLPYFYDYIKNDLVFQGHTHIYNLEGQYINPGSIGEPRNYKEHTFILYKDGLLSLIDLDNYEVLQERQL